jgi:zona occludens toxin (predicted ATPase)
MFMPQSLSNSPSLHYASARKPLFTPNQGAFMNRILPLLAAVLAGATFAWAQAPATAPTSQPATAAASAPGSQPGMAANAAIPADLAKTLQQAISLTEQGNYRDLIDMLAPPDAVARMKASGDYDNAVANFGRKATMLLDALRQAIALPPEFSNEGKTATFHVTGPKPEMKFNKGDDGKWTLQ